MHIRTLVALMVVCLAACDSCSEENPPDSDVGDQDRGDVAMATDMVADVGVRDAELGTDTGSDMGVATDLGAGDVGDSSMDLGEAPDMMLPDPPDPQPWAALGCAMPSGANDRLGFTTDDGMNVAPAMQGVVDVYGAGVVVTGAANTMYLASDELYRSTDGGCTWTTIQAVNADYITASRFEDRVVLASAFFDEISRVDAGVVTSLTAPTMGVDTVALSRVLSDRIFVSSDNQLYRSDDGGVTWLPHGVDPLTLFPELSFCSGIHVDPTDDDHLFADCGGGLVSFDGGQSWLVPNGYTNFDFANVLFVAMQGDIVWLYGSDSGDLEFRRSLDGGRNFDLITSETLRAQGVWPHPTDADKVYYSNVSDLCNFDIARGTEQCFQTSSPFFLDVINIAFHPEDPSQIYIAWGL